MRTDRKLSEVEVVSKIIAFTIQMTLYATNYAGSKFDPHNVLSGTLDITYQFVKRFGLSLSDLPTHYEFLKTTLEMYNIACDTSIDDTEKTSRLSVVSTSLINKYVEKYKNGSNLLEMPWMGTLQ